VHDDVVLALKESLLELDQKSLCRGAFCLIEVHFCEDVELRFDGFDKVCHFDGVVVVVVELEDELRLKF